jgi:hypothetical protein
VLDWIAQPGFRFGDATQVPLYLQPSGDSQMCLADLSLAEWVGPATLVSLAAFLDRQSISEGRDVKVIAPEDEDLSRYISRMGFARLLDEMGIGHNFGTVRANSDLNAKSLVEVSRFSSVGEVEELISILTYRDVPTTLRDIMCEMLSEMAINVPQHARVKHGFMAAQVVDKGRTLKLSVADSGVGLFATLRPQGAESGRHAIRMALEGATETRRAGGGRGVKSMAAAIAEARGRAFLLSGEDMMTITSTGTAPWLHLRSFPGTIFDASLPIA